MSYEYVIDSYAWIEYFRGTRSGNIVRPYVESDRAATSTLTIAELKEKYLREKWPSFEEDLEFLSTRTFVAPVSRTIALIAGELNHVQKKSIKEWGMSDSLILATARSTSAKVVTGDRHFEGLPEAIIV